MKEHYPLPKTNQPLTLAASNREPEFGATREEFEERLFRTADHFNIVRFGTHNGSEIKTVRNFAEAIYWAHNNPRVLIYVVTLSGNAFCMSRKDYNRYAEIWLSMRKQREPTHDTH
jgi:hypothetical protein